MRPGRCPICRQEVSPEDPHRPFCSERCRLVDLSHWASGRYRIPGEDAPPDAVPDADGPKSDDPER